MSCPICEHPECQVLIVDLLVCGSCGHIFKDKPVTFDSNSMPISALHRYENPVNRCQLLHDQLPEDKMMVFTFPSMNFYGQEIAPGLFYRHDYNHYFNQMSLMILFERAGLIPIDQRNIWSGNICETTLTVRKPTILR